MLFQTWTGCNTNEGKLLENMNSESFQEPLRSVTASNTVQTFLMVS